MVRVFSFATLILLLSISRASIEESAGRPLLQHRAVADHALLISDAVKTRFALDGAVAKCRFSENLYAYRALRDRFTGETRALIEAAADAGRGEPSADASSEAACTTAVERLRAADDRLLALAESIERN